MDQNAQDYQRAKDEYNQAWQNFNNASKEYVDDAIKLLHAAELRLDAVVSKTKKSN